MRIARRTCDDVERMHARLVHASLRRWHAPRTTPAREGALTCSARDMHEQRSPSVAGVAVAPALLSGWQSRPLSRVTALSVMAAHEYVVTCGERSERGRRGQRGRGLHGRRQ